MKLLFFYLFELSSFVQPLPHDRWKDFFNTNIDSIHRVYSSNAVIVTPDGMVYTSAKDRAAFYAKLKNEIGKVKSVTTLHQEEITPGLRFEIGYFIAGNNKKFNHLIIGRKVNDDFIREVELVSESSGEPVSLAGINEARSSWMKLCNSHRANELVSNAYTTNAVYYNNNRVLVGAADITREYRYMNNPSYQLTLTPIIVEAAGKNLAFEIGQCSGSYQGKYTLIWKKSDSYQKGNDWKVMFDSN